jgi:glycosyltransferase involved in cell wall biosynthesis
MASIVVVDAYAKAFLNFRGRFLAELVARGHKVVAAAPDFGAPLEDGLRTMGVEPFVIRLERIGTNPLKELASLLSLWRLFRSRGPDAVVLYTSKAMIYGALAAWAARVPRRYAVVTGLGYGFVATSAKGKVISAIQRTLYHLSLPLCQVILFQNPDDKALFERLRLTGRAQLGVVNGSGVDTMHFAPAVLPDSVSFLMIGRLLISKGVREYLAAAEMLSREFPRARFRLVGWLDSANPDSISEGELMDALARSGVEFLGRLSDVRPALAECSVFVLPSYREGTPRSVLEAMAMGRAVVTSDAPGCRETVVDGKTGYLVQPGNAQALARAMRRYAHDPSLAATHGAAGRRMAERKYEVGRVTDSIMQMLSLAESESI